MPQLLHHTYVSRGDSFVAVFLPSDNQRAGMNFSVDSLTDTPREKRKKKKKKKKKTCYYVGLYCAVLFRPPTNSPPPAHTSIYLLVHTVYTKYMCWVGVGCPSHWVSLTITVLVPFFVFWWSPRLAVEVDHVCGV